AVVRPGAVAHQRPRWGGPPGALGAAGRPRSCGRRPAGPRRRGDAPPGPARGPPASRAAAHRTRSDVAGDVGPDQESAVSDDSAARRVADVLEITVSSYAQAREALRSKDLRQALYDEGDVVM